MVSGWDAKIGEMNGGGAARPGKWSEFGAGNFVPAVRLARKSHSHGDGNTRFPLSAGFQTCCIADFQIGSA